MLRVRRQRHPRAARLNVPHPISVPHLQCAAPASAECGAATPGRREQFCRPTHGERCFNARMRTISRGRKKWFCHTGEDSKMVRGESKRIAIDLRNPLAKARDEWLESQDGKDCCDGEARGQYLRNRLEAAFIAGWTAKENSLFPAGCKELADVSKARIEEAFGVSLQRSGLCTVRGKSNSGTDRHSTGCRRLRRSKNRPSPKHKAERTALRKVSSRHCTSGSL